MNHIETKMLMAVITTLFLSAVWLTGCAPLAGGASRSHGNGTPR